MTSEVGSGIGAVAKLQERYRILAKLGSGGMADVFLGVQLGEEAFQQLVVIKRVHAVWLENQNAMQMFIAEARTVASLHHPHIVKIIDLSRLGKDVCIVMEYVNGENLDFVRKAVHKADTTIPLPIVCKWMIEASDALQYAHTAKTPDGKPLDLIHRDIGPHNLMTDTSGYLKVIDFGIAKSTARSDLTTPGMIKGKFSYLAPDLFLHEQIDGRADLYALGLVFHELLTCKRCCTYKKDVTVAEVLKRVTSEQLPAPSELAPGLPPELDRIVLKALAKDREQRYQTGEQLAADVLHFAETTCGLASSSDVEAWYQQALSERCQKRREFEARALEKAKATLDQEALAEEDGLQESVQFKTSNLSPVTGASQFQVDPQASINLSQGPAPRRTNPYVLLILAFLLFAGAALLVHRLFFANPAPDAASVASPGPGPAPATRPASNQLVRASEPYAAVQPDGGRADQAPKDEPEIPLAQVAESDAADRQAHPADAHRPARRPGKHTPPGHRGTKLKGRPSARALADAEPDQPVPDAEPVAAPTPVPQPPPESTLEKPPVRVPEPRLKPVAAPATSPASSPKVAPPTEPATPTPKLAVAQQVQWFSGDGSWSGAQVATRGCTRCHGAGKAPALDWSRKTARQWKYFFRRKRHNRHTKLEDNFSKQELQRVVAYILKQLPEQDRSGIAGVK